MRLLTVINAETLLSYKKKDAFGGWLEEVRCGLKEGKYKIKKHFNMLGERKSCVEIWKE